MVKSLAKVKSIFICENCGYESPKWLGKCPDCNNWNTFEESLVEKKSSVAAVAKKVSLTMKPVKKLSDITSICNIGMTEQYAYGLVVAVAFNAACGKAVAESVVFQPRNVKAFHQPMIVVAVGAWLCRFLLVGQYIEVCVYHLFQRFHHSQKFFVHRYLTA